MTVTSTLLEDVVARFQDPKPNGNGIKFRCPAHDDRMHSGHASIGRDGRVLLKCHAGCETAAILEAVGMTFADLYPPRDRHQRPTTGATVQIPYDYRDEQGTLLYQNVRRQTGSEKTFIARQPTPGGDWVWNLNGVPRVIYRLREVRAAIAEGRPIVYVEGEKDADRLWSLGHAATTHALGAKAFRPEYADQLAGAIVVLLPDHDQPGYEMAWTAYQAISKTAESVRVVQVAGMPPKADFSDYADAIGDDAAAAFLMFNDPHRPDGDGPYLRTITPETLAHLASGRPDDEPDPEPDLGLIYTRFSDITEEPIKWVWQDYLAAGKFHLLAGTQGDGKSTLATDIAACLSSGKTLPNNARAPICRVGFLVSEDGVADTVLPRLRMHGANLDNVFAIEGVRTPDGKQLVSLGQHLPQLRQFIEAERIDVLFVDALSDFMPGIKQNDNGEVRSILAPLVELGKETGCAVLGIVHLAKGGSGVKRAIERILGSGAFGQVARAVWAVTVNGDDESQRYFGVIKSNLAPEPPTLRWHRDRDQPICWDGLAQTSVKTMMNGNHEKTSKTDEARDFLERFLADGPQPRQEVISKGSDAGIGKNSIYTAADMLGVIKAKEQTFGGAWMWRLPVDSEAADAA